ncbi:CshA/CshB family fibrillar adhesin-related protein [Leucobacter chromiireducens]|uniref:CshA/CshB family fibrillar adhesin-related protein n=1 Tax=Leucobacter chromiireducens TaxID=283877 RepID=UPI000F63F356|nr:CshA/CshB family fibrillar adhesin-related protein [Leucobacter chromiireducens]
MAFGHIARTNRLARFQRSGAFIAAIAVVAGAIVALPGISGEAPAQADFAEGGTGEHRSSIDWFTFPAAEQPIADGQRYTNERQIGADKIVSTCTISGVSGEISTYRSGSFAGDGLSRLYYQGGPGTLNTMVTGITNTQFGGAASFDFDCSASYVTADGTTTPIPLQGLVVADAESSSSQTGEWLQVDPRPLNTPVNWRIIDRARNADCTETTLANPTPQGGIRFDPQGYECIGWTSEGYGPMAVGFMEGATAAHVSMQGGGHSAVALGMVMSVDFGDAPESFGAAGAIFQPEWQGTIIPGTGATDVFSDAFELSVPGESPLTLGTHVDAETEHLHSWDALLDDETDSPSDEDAIPLDQLPRAEEGHRFNNGDPLTVACRANGTTGFVAGWLDWNRDGSFDPDTERSEIAECAGGTATLSWPQLAELGPAEGAYGPVVYLRLRIAASEDGLNPTGVLVPTGVGSAGEVEDYALGVPLITAVKESDPLSGAPVVHGTEITYTLTFHNTGQVPGQIVYDDFIGGVLDKAEFVPGSISITSPDGDIGDVAATEPAGSPARISLSGEMAPGKIINVSYTVRVTSETAGDVLQNFLIHVDDNGDPLEEIPETCLESNPRCTTHEVLGSDLQVRKSSLPGDGQAVSPGQLVTYRLDFQNWGAAEATVDHVDHLAEVLRYGTFLPDSLRIVGASDPADPGNPEAHTIAATFDEAASTLSVTGTLRGNAAGRVEYVVRVDDPVVPEGETAPVLTNFVVAGDEEPPTVCATDPEPGSELCTEHPVKLPDLQIAKSADPESGTLVSAGDVLTYSLTFDNSAGAAAATVAHDDDLSGVLDDATFGEVTDDGGLDVAGPASGKLTITGLVPAGATRTVTYTVTVNDPADRGDDVLSNFLLEEGATPPGECLPEDPCTTHPAGDPNLVLAKSADPASGEPVVAGQTVSYSLSFDNTAGTAPAPLDHTDDLSDVLDDATFVAGSLTASAGVTATGPDGSGKISVTGAVAAGETATVSYQVTVNDPVADGAELANFLFAGDEAPETCVPGDPCTVHPGTKPDLQVTKQANPETGTEVFEDDELTYTLQFENTGSAPADVAYTDNLSGVLDDAELIQDPMVAPAGALTGAIVDGELAITGTLAPGASATVTYRVRVLPEADRGDHSLGNFLFPTGTEPPTTCAPESELCTEHPAPLPDLVVQKLVDVGSTTPVEPGDELRYGLEFNNSSGRAPAPVSYVDDLSGVLDDAAFDPASLEVPAGLTAVYSEPEQTITVTGTVPAGQTLTVRYVVTVLADGERGDNELVNFLFAEGTEPPTVCTPEELCTTNPVPALEVTKTADPASGQPVAAGDTVRYTLTFDNRAGKAPAAVEHTDDLSDVLDDATFVADSLQADAGLTAAGPSAGLITITGTVPAGERLTVSYEATVKDDGERGNNSLANFLFAGDEKPEVCEPGEPCTVHPVPNLTVRKGVDPESGTTVSAGDTLRYTLTFDNSAGTAPATVDHRDDLRGVLDDAAFVAGSLEADAGLTATGPSGDALQISGTVPAGETLTVRYRVEVLPDGERGDNVLANFLLAPGVTEPPITCEEGDEACTTNPVPEVSYVKEVTASDDPIVAGESTLSYTVTITNTGAATGDVARTDDLSDVLDDATVVSQPASDTPSVTVTEIADEAFTIGGTLAAGATAKVTYTVRVKEAAAQGNSQAANFLLPPGVTEPPEVCEPGDPECTETPLPAIRPAKSAVTESGESWVRAGEAITYTLTFTNDGAAAGPVAYWDGLHDVLTSADFEGEITVNQDAGSSVAAVFNAADERIDVSGVLAARQTATVVYTMRMHADLPHGARVTNYLVGEGESLELPGCFPDDDVICTDHPAVMPGLDVSKSADPASGTEVREGDEVTYTLSFDAWGPDRAAVQHRDILNDVVDDAELITQPVVAIDGDGTLKAVLARGANGEARIDVRGSLAAGTHATVSYTVRVLPDRERPAAPAAEGTTPHQLGNVVIGAGEEPPLVCEPAAPNCTVHPVETKPDIEVTKQVDPESGTAVAAGEQLSYTLGFENFGTAAGAVDFEDRLAGVLDDAALISGPTVSGAGLTATLDGDVLRIAGELAPKQRATVSYTVEVLPSAADGEGVLLNFVVKPGDPTPEVCDPAQLPCTANPVIPEDPTKPIPKPPLAETGGASTLPWLLGGAGLLGAGALLVTLALARRARRGGAIATQE